MGWVLGTALQLQQGALGSLWLYAALALTGLALGVALWRRLLIRLTGSQRRAAWLLVAAALGFGATGLRCLHYDIQALAPALEGRNVLLTGVVTVLPQRNESGLRFTLDTESAALDGQAVFVPAKIDVGWYGGVYALGGEQVGLQRQPGDVRAGACWCG